MPQTSTLISPFTKSDLATYTKRVDYVRQSISDAYAEPDNMLEIEVCNPVTHTQAGEFLFTEYEVRTNTNIPVFGRRKFVVRRRYSDFEWLHKELVKETRVQLPELPGKWLFSRLSYTNGIFDPIFIEKRRALLETFINRLISHPLVQFEKCVHLFLQEKVLDKESYVAGRVPYTRG